MIVLNEYLLRIHNARRERIEAAMKARREAEKANHIDQSKPGWSEGMTWDELLDARQYPYIKE